MNTIALSASGLSKPRMYGASTDNAVCVASFAPQGSIGLTCATDYEAERLAYEDTKRFKDLAREMRTNRAPWL